MTTRGYKNPLRRGFYSHIDAGCQVSVVERRTQGRDHPVLLGVPETQYMTCLILRKMA